MNPVLDACLIGNQSCAMRAHLAQKPGRLIRNPYFRKEIASQQLRKHCRIDLVGLDFRFSDRLDLQRISNRHFGDLRQNQVGNFPGVGRGLHYDVIGRLKALSNECLDTFPCNGNTTPMELLSLLIDKAGFNELFVDVESYISWHGRSVSFLWRILNRKPLGHLTTISSSSKLSRVGRNGEPDKKAGSEPKNVIGQPQNERLVARFWKFFILPASRSVATLQRPIGTKQVDVASKKNLTTLAPYPVKKALGILGQDPWNSSK